MPSQPPRPCTARSACPGLTLAWDGVCDACRRAQGPAVRLVPALPTDRPLSGFVLVAGPPCAGKSTWAQKTGLPVLDWDDLHAQVARLPAHARPSDPDAARELAHRVEGQFHEAVALAWADRRPAVIIRGAPVAEQRALYARRYGARVVVLETPAAECLRRLYASSRPRAVHELTAWVIGRWWKEYQRCPDMDEVVT